MSCIMTRFCNFVDNNCWLVKSKLLHLCDVLRPNLRGNNLGFCANEVTLQHQVTLAMSQPVMLTSRCHFKFVQNVSELDRYWFPSITGKVYPPNSVDTMAMIANNLHYHFNIYSQKPQICVGRKRSIVNCQDAFCDNF